MLPIFVLQISLVPPQSPVLWHDVGELGGGAGEHLPDPCSCTHSTITDRVSEVGKLRACLGRREGKLADWKRCLPSRTGWSCSRRETYTT